MTADASSLLRASNVAQREGAVAAGVGTAILGVSVIGLALSQRGIELAAGLPAWLAVAGFVGLSAMVVASWVIQAERPGVTTGLSVMVVGLAVPSWTAWDWVPAGVGPILLAAGPISVAGSAHVGLSWLGRTRRARALTATYVIAALAVVVIAIAYDPFADPGCAFTCADAEPVARNVLTTRGAVTATALLLVAAGGIGAWALAAERGAPRVLRLGVGACLALLVVAWPVHALRWTDPSPDVAPVVLHVVAANLAAAAVLAAWWAVRRNRMAAERLIAGLNDGISTVISMRGVRAVEFAVPGEERWVDPDGHPVLDGRPDGDAVVLLDGAVPAVRVWLAPGAAPPDLDSVSASARVALATARLTAVARARLEDVRESRRRIIRASDAERRRIERDLHDGAQQRLITASLHVSVAASRLPEASVARIQAAIGDALDQLRRIAHGLVPDTQRVQALGAALEDLIRTSEVPATLDMAEVGVDDNVSMAVCAVVMAALAHARDVGAERAHVTVARPSLKRLALGIEVQGLSGLDSWDETPVAGRVAAVGGTMAVDARPTRFLLQVELPCAS